MAEEGDLRLEEVAFLQLERNAVALEEDQHFLDVAEVIIGGAGGEDANVIDEDNDFDVEKRSKDLLDEALGCRGGIC